MISWNSNPWPWRMSTSRSSVVENHISTTNSRCPGVALFVHSPSATPLVWLWMHDGCCALHHCSMHCQLSTHPSIRIAGTRQQQHATWALTAFALCGYLGAGMREAAGEVSLLQAGTSLFWSQTSARQFQHTGPSAVEHLINTSGRAPRAKSDEISFVTFRRSFWTALGRTQIFAKNEVTASKSSMSAVPVETRPRCNAACVEAEAELASCLQYGLCRLQSAC